MVRGTSGAEKRLDPSLNTQRLLRLAEVSTMISVLLYMRGIYGYVAKFRLAHSKIAAAEGETALGIEFGQETGALRVIRLRRD